MDGRQPKSPVVVRPTTTLACSPVSQRYPVREETCAFSSRHDGDNDTKSSHGHGQSGSRGSVGRRVCYQIRFNSNHWILFGICRRELIGIWWRTPRYPEFSVLSRDAHLDRFDANAQAATFKLYLTVRALGYDPNIVEDLVAGIANPFAQDLERISEAQRAVELAMKAAGAEAG